MTTIIDRTALHDRHTDLTITGCHLGYSYSTGDHDTALAVLAEELRDKDATEHPGAPVGTPYDDTYRRPRLHRARQILSMVVPALILTLCLLHLPTLPHQAGIDLLIAWVMATTALILTVIAALTWVNTGIGTAILPATTKDRASTPTTGSQETAPGITLLSVFYLGLELVILFSLTLARALVQVDELTLGAAQQTATRLITAKTHTTHPRPSTTGPRHDPPLPLVLHIT